MTQHLAAFTPPGDSPPFLSIIQNDGRVEITVRSSPKPDGACGDQAAINLTIDEFRRLIDEAGNRLFFRKVA